MRYRSDYQETHDIDWFFRYKGKAYHAASNGGRLPDDIDSERNRLLQEKLEDVKGVFKVVYEEGIREFYGQGADLSSFEEYAKKGFISLDRCEVEEGKMIDKLKYRVVVSPAEGSFNNEEMLKMMPELKEEIIEIVNNGN